MTHAHACIAEPISYLRLERHALRELPAEEHARIDGHLAQCEACRACFEALRGSEIALPALPLTATRARVTPLRRFATLGSALAAAAVVTLALRSVMVPAMTGPLQPRRGQPYFAERVLCYLTLILTTRTILRRTVF